MSVSHIFCRKQNKSQKWRKDVLRHTEDIGESSYLGRIVRWMDARQFPNDGGVERIEIEADLRYD